MTASRVSALLLLAIVPASAMAAPPRARGAADWRTVVVATPEGGIRTGDPAAAVRLVEYGSFTCPHCGAFSREASAPIRDRYVRTGKVSFEFRVALRDRIDLVAALTARCGGPAKADGLATAIFAAQPDWEQKAIDWDEAHPAAFDGPGGPKAMAALADASGLAAVAAARQVTGARLLACYGDKALIAALGKTADKAWNVLKIGGTPAFYLNGRKLDDVYGWTALEPRLQTALKP